MRIQMTLDVNSDYMAASDIVECSLRDVRCSLRDQTLSHTIAAGVSRKQLVERFDEYLEDAISALLKWEQYEAADEHAQDLEDQSEESAAT